VNVNTATQAQLEQLPGFGEVSAKPSKVHLETGPLANVLALLQAA